MMSEKEAEKLRKENRELKDKIQAYKDYEEQMEDELSSSHKWIDELEKIVDEVKLKELRKKWGIKTEEELDASFASILEEMGIKYIKSDKTN